MDCENYIYVSGMYLKDGISFMHRKSLSDTGIRKGPGVYPIRIRVFEKKQGVYRQYIPADSHHGLFDRLADLQKEYPYQIIMDENIHPKR